MSLDEFIIFIFCIVDDYVKTTTSKYRLRRRGFYPKLSDSEVITMEIIGEFLECDTDKGIWEYFIRHWKDWFPAIGSRATFAKQCANLWKVKQKIWKHLVNLLGADKESVHIVDGFPIPICHFKRAYHSCCFRGEAAYGYCASKNETYYGFHGLFVIDFNGVISEFTVTPANIDERDALWECIPSIQGLLVGDKGFISNPIKECLLIENIQLETPLRKNMKDDRDQEYVKSLMSIRRLVETVIGQLAGRFNIEKVWARDLWHLTNRLTRKVLSHTMCVFLNRQHGRDPLQLDGLVHA